VYEQQSMLGVLAFAAAIGALAFLFASIVSLSPVIAQTTETTTTIPEIPQTSESSQLLTMIDNEPFYRAIDSNLTNVEIVDANPSVVVHKVSFSEIALMRNIGNVSNIGTFVETVFPDGTLDGVGKGVITTENGDRISWNAYDIGLTANGNGNNDTASGSLNTERMPTFRGIIFLHTTSENLSFMNNVVGLYINDENGRQIWEWRNS
jgi:hypothetical protein